MKIAFCTALLLLGGCHGGLQGIDFSKANCPSSNAGESSAGPSTSNEPSKVAGLRVSGTP